MRGLEQARYRARRSFKRRIAEKETQNPAIIAKVGNGAGTVVVSGRPGWIYVRLHGDDNQLTQAKLGIPLDTGSLDDAWVRVKRASPRKTSYYAVEEFITSSTGDPAPPMSAHPLDPDAGPHEGTLPEDEVVFDDVEGHDHQGVGNTGKKVACVNLAEVAQGVQIELINRTGGHRAAGDVVVTDPDNDESFIGTTTQGYQGKVLVVAASAEFQLSAGSLDHTDYGLSYPLTYIFDIPAALASGKVYYRYSEDEEWVQLTVKTPDDFFNGIDAVRFDYANDKAYVSIAFSSGSDEIYLKFTDSDNDPVECSYDSMAPYYDDRKAVVVLTADDWAAQAGRDADFQAACGACQSRSIWITVAIITSFGGNPPTWAAIQTELDQGYVEAAGHSRTHPHIPYGDYVAEIDTCRAEIESNLDLPSLYKKGSDEYVPAWLEPFAESDAAQRSQCGASKYLADRDATTDHVFATWDAAKGLYNRIGFSIMMGSDPGATTNVATLNASFDARYAAGGIYHLMFHPYNVDWTPGQYATQHLDHIKDKKDVWYVGFGALYLYHYAQERDIVAVAETAILCWERGGPFDVKVINAVSRNDPLRTSATIYRAAAAPSMTGGGVFAIALSPNISGDGTVKAVFLDAVGAGGGGDGAGTIEIQEDDGKVADADTVNFEGGGGKVTDEGGGKVTVDITPGGGDGGGAWTLIEDIELGAPAATIDFQNIPGTYKHLAILYSLRTDRAASEIDVATLRFNNSAAGYDWMLWAVTPAGLGAQDGLNDPEIQLSGYTPATASPAGSFGCGIIRVNDYVDTSKLPSAECLGGFLRAREANKIYMGGSYGEWRTAAAVSRITLLPLLGTNFVAGSRVTLYGIGEGGGGSEVEGCHGASYPISNQTINEGATYTSGDLRDGTVVASDAIGVWMMLIGSPNAANKLLVIESADDAPDSYSSRMRAPAATPGEGLVMVRLGTGANAGKVKIKALSGNWTAVYAWPVGYWK